MAQINYANLLLNELAGKQYRSTSSILNALGSNAKPRPETLKVLHALKNAGILESMGVGKIQWHLPHLTWNRNNPFAPAKPDPSIVPKKDEQGKPMHKAQYPGRCPRCEGIIHVGARIEQGVEGGKWVHVNCSSKQQYTANVTFEPAAGSPYAAPNQPNEQLVQFASEIAQKFESALAEIDKLHKHVASLEAKTPRIIKLERPQAPTITIEEKVHPIFEQLMFHLHCGDNVMLVGPKGCGKTTVCQQVADALVRPFSFMSLSGGVTEGKIFGRTIPNIHTGEEAYRRTPFVEAWEAGGVFLLDEIDGGDPNTLLSLNTALANGVLTVDRAKHPIIKRHDEFICVAAANTWGNGADRKYVGRNQLDSAFMERFVPLAMDYDHDLERTLCGAHPEMVERLHKYRAKTRSANMEREISTRFMLRAKNWLEHGKDMNYVEQMLFAGWRKDEVNTVKSA